MKKYMICLSLLAMLAGCGEKNKEAEAEEVDPYAYRYECPEDVINHQHQFMMPEIYTTMELGHDGWYVEQCTLCGQAFKFNTAFDCDKQYGTVCIFCPPGDSIFNDLCVCYEDTTGLHYQTVNVEDVRYNPDLEN